MPTHYNNIVSLTKFSRAAEALSQHLESLELRMCNWLIAGDLNCNPYENHIHSDIFMNCLPTTFKIWPKSLDSPYTHTSGHTSNINHVLSCLSIPSLPVTVWTFVQIQSSQSTKNACSKKLVYTQIWEKCNTPLYIATVASIPSSIKVLFHLFCSGPSNA